MGNQFAKYSNGTPLPIDVAITEYVGDKLDVATRTYMFNAARNISKRNMHGEREMEGGRKGGREEGREGGKGGRREGEKGGMVQ